MSIRFRSPAIDSVEASTPRPIWRRSVRSFRCGLRRVMCSPISNMRTPPPERSTQPVFLKGCEPHERGTPGLACSFAVQAAVAQWTFANARRELSSAQAAVAQTGAASGGSRGPGFRLWAELCDVPLPLAAGGSSDEAAHADSCAWAGRFIQLAVHDRQHRTGLGCGL